MSTETDNNYKDMADEQLMVLTSKGDKTAFTALIRRHQQAMMNFFGKMGVYNHVEDLTQETFVKLFNYRDRYEPRAKFTTFLYIVARRIYLDHIRKANREKEGCEKYTEDLKTQQAGGYEDGSLKAEAVEALNKLSDEMKSVLTLNIYQGMKYREIAEVLEISEGTVKTRMFYAIRKLREHLSNNDAN